MAKVHPLHVINAERQGAVAKLYTKPGSYRFYIHLLFSQFMHISYVTVTNSTKTGIMHKSMPTECWSVSHTFLCDVLARHPQS